MFDQEKSTVLADLDALTAKYEGKIAELQTTINADTTAISAFQLQVKSDGEIITALQAQLAQLQSVVVIDRLEYRQPSINTDTSVGGSGLAATGRDYMRYINECGCLPFPEYLQSIWPWMKYRHIVEISTMFGKVMSDTMTLEALCDQVRAWEDELALKGVNVEQVTMAATPEPTHESVAEKTKSVVG